VTDTGPVFALDLAAVPEADWTTEPQGFVVEADHRVRIHFLDWGGPAAAVAPGVLLLHGLGQTGWAWTPVARRLCHVARVVSMDLRGHGLSDSPTEGYDPETLAADVIAVAEGSGLLDRAEPGSHLVLAGHGFGGIVAAWGAVALGPAVVGLALIDGGWEDIARSTGIDPDEFLRGLEEPPEVLRSMEAYLADRRDFDPATWDADQEHAARATVVEAHSKRVTSATRPHAIAGSVQAMFEYDPLVVLPSVEAAVVALRAADDDEGSHAGALREAQVAMTAAGRPPIRVASFPDAGHNLMRYRPAAVAAVIQVLAGTLPP